MAVAEGDEGQMEEDKDGRGQAVISNMNKKSAGIRYDTQPLRVCIWSGCSAPHPPHFWDAGYGPAQNFGLHTCTPARWDTCA